MSSYQKAESLLSVVLSAFSNAGVSVPDRQVIYMSPIPADCEQIAVMINGISLMGATDGITNCLTTPLIIGFSVIVTRKTCAVPIAKGTKVTPPSPEKMSLAAEIASKDADVFVDVLSAVDGFSSAEIITQSPAGGFQTVELDLSIPYI